MRSASVKPTTKILPRQSLGIWSRLPKVLKLAIFFIAAALNAGCETSNLASAPNDSAAETEAEQALESAYPRRATLNINDNELAQINQDLRAQGVIESDLTLEALTWEHLSHYSFRTGDHAAYLRRLNGGKARPAEVRGWVRTQVARGYSGWNMAVGVRTRAGAPEPLTQPPQTEPVPAEPTQPVPVKTNGNGHRPTNGKRVNRDGGPRRGRTSISLSPNSAPEGSEGHIYVNVTGDIPEGEPRVRISGNHRIRRIRVSVSDPHTLRIDMSLENARPGRYRVTVSSGEHTVGRANFTVTPRSQEEE